MDKIIIEKIINNIISTKTHYTISQMHSILDNYTTQEKETLLKYTIDGYNESDNEFYHNLLKNGSEEDIFNYERQILDKFKDTRRNNILEYLTDFDESTFQRDIDGGYPNHNRGVLEKRMEDIQETIGYSPEIITSIKDGWTNGFFQDIQDYILTGEIEDYLKSPSFKSVVDTSIIGASKHIQDFIENSHGLDVNTILFRGGFFEDDSKIGDVKTIPCFNSTSYSRDTAYELGVLQNDYPDDQYMITVYAPRGTKGCMVNAPSLAPKFPEHEYLLGKGQKYIIVDVDHNTRNATILLIND